MQNASVKLCWRRRLCINCWQCSSLWSVELLLHPQTPEIASISATGHVQGSAPALFNICIHICIYINTYTTYKYIYISILFFNSSLWVLRGTVGGLILYFPLTELYVCIDDDISTAATFVTFLVFLFNFYFTITFRWPFIVLICAFCRMIFVY